MDGREIVCDEEKVLVDRIFERLSDPELVRLVVVLREDREKS